MSEGLEEDDGGGADVDDILGRVVAGVDLYLLHYESTASAGLHSHGSTSLLAFIMLVYLMFYSSDRAPRWVLVVTT